MKNQMFGHIDANYFYAACHLVFHPEQREEAVIVLSNNDSAVVSTNIPAKQLGIAKGASVSHLKGVLNRHRIYIYSSQYALYADMSRRFLDILTELVPDVEYYSIDEMFFDLTAVPFGERLDLVARVKEEIARQIGLPTSIGIGATKTLSKLANRQAKGNASGLFDLSDPQRVTELLSVTPIEDIWGIGSRRAEYLHERMGVHSALDLTKVPDGQLRRTLHVPVARLSLELKGTSALPIILLPPPAHSISRARSFGRQEADFDQIHEALIYFVSRAAEQLRAQHRAATYLSVFLMTSPFRKDRLHYSNSCVLSLPRPSNSTLDLLSSASLALERIYRRGYEYARVGVSLLELVPESPLQQTLFESLLDMKRQQRLMDVIDRVNQRFGQDTLRVASLGLDQGWQRRTAYPSPRLTTRWVEIPVIQS